MDSAFIGFLAVCSVLRQGHSLSCYECNSQEDPSCLDHPPASALKQCSYSNPLCRIMYEEVKTPHDVRVIRNCGEAEPKDDEKSCYHISDYGSYQKVCSCREDSCNSSSKLIFNIIILMSITSVFLLLY